MEIRKSAAGLKELSIRIHRAAFDAEDSCHEIADRLATIRQQGRQIAPIAAREILWAGEDLIADLDRKLAEFDPEAAGLLDCIPDAAIVDMGRIAGAREKLAAQLERVRAFCRVGEQGGGGVESLRS